MKPVEEVFRKATIVAELEAEELAEVVHVQLNELLQRVVFGGGRRLNVDDHAARLPAGPEQDPPA